MSLSSQLRDKSSPASRFFTERFPDARSAQRDLVARAADSKTLLPDVSGTYQWNLVGTAVDYRIRLAFPQSVAYADRWDVIPPMGFVLMRGHHLLPPLPAEESACTGRLEGWAAHFFASLRDTLRTAARSLPNPETERELARHCYVLGLYDSAYRAGPRAPSPLYDVPALAGVAAIPRLCPSGTVEDRDVGLVPRDTGRPPQATGLPLVDHLPARTIRIDAGLPVPTNGRYGDAFYQAVAEVYLQLLRYVRSPAGAIADANNVPVSTAHRWIKIARARKYLPPGARAKAG